MLPDLLRGPAFPSRPGLTKRPAMLAPGTRKGGEAAMDSPGPAPEGQDVLGAPDKGIGSVIAGLFESLFGGDEKGATAPGLNSYGEFNPIQFVDATLQQVKGGGGGSKEGSGIAKLLGSLLGA